MQGKSLIESKTLWFNLVTAILALSDLLPHPYGMAVNVAGNLVLRVFYTEQPITSAAPK